MNELIDPKLVSNDYKLRKIVQNIFGDKKLNRIEDYKIKNDIGFRFNAKYLSQMEELENCKNNFFGFFSFRDSLNPLWSRLIFSGLESFSFYFSTFSNSTKNISSSLLRNITASSLSTISYVLPISTSAYFCSQNSQNYLSFFILSQFLILSAAPLSTLSNHLFLNRAISIQDCLKMQLTPTKLLFNASISLSAILQSSDRSFLNLLSLPNSIISGVLYRLWTKNYLKMTLHSYVSSQKSMKFEGFKESFTKLTKNDVPAVLAFTLLNIISPLLIPNLKPRSSFEREWRKKIDIFKFNDNENSNYE